MLPDLIVMQLLWIFDSLHPLPAGLYGVWGRQGYGWIGRGGINIARGYQINNITHLRIDLQPTCSVCIYSTSILGWYASSFSYSYVQQSFKAIKVQKGTQFSSTCTGWQRESTVYSISCSRCPLMNTFFPVGLLISLRDSSSGVALTSMILSILGL